ncbi:hypothetical protein D3C80_1664040 [compost metagenome]
MREVLQLDLLPWLSRLVEIGRAPETRGLGRRVLHAREILRAAQSEQTVHEQRGIHVQRGVERQQAGVAQGHFRACHRAAHQAGEVHHGGQGAAQIGHAHEPGLGIGHGQDARPGEDLSRLGQGHQVFAAAGFHRQPARRGHAFTARRL